MRTNSCSRNATAICRCLTVPDLQHYQHQEYTPALGQPSSCLCHQIEHTSYAECGDSRHVRHYPEKRGGNCLPCLIASYTHGQLPNFKFDKCYTEPFQAISPNLMAAKNFPVYGITSTPIIHQFFHMKCILAGQCYSSAVLFGSIIYRQTVHIKVALAGVCTCSNGLGVHA